MKFTPLEHRSDAWFERRLGRPTASQFGRLITPTGKPSTSAQGYAAELIAERIFKRRFKDISGIPAVRHGTETEPEAADVLQSILGVPLMPGGFMTDDLGRYGCSPDRLIVIGNRRELAEIKCPGIPKHVANLLFGPGDDYKAQVQGQLLISGFDTGIFFSYEPQCPPCMVRVERDDRYIATLRQILDEFCAQLDIDHQRALKMGAWGT